VSALLEEVWQHRLVTVIAPAGYGKSTAIGQFVEATPAARQAWLSLDERDADPVRLGHHLLAALDGVRPGIGDAVAATLDGASRGLGDRFVDALLAQLWQSRDEFVLVLEDVDRADVAVAADLSRLVLEAPGHVHFVASARLDPNLPAARLRSRSDLFEIRADDLRFTAAETQALVATVAGVHLTADAADHLGRRTEGWPVAVYLVALSLAGTGQTDPVLAIGATERNIVDYMSAEILAFESAEVRSFLQDTSVLDLLDADMCDFVLQRSDSARILADLSQRGVFISRADDGAARYRCYRLLREFLRQDLLSVDPGRPSALRRRAATRSLERGEVEVAAGHLVEAEDWAGLAELIRLHGRALWEQGRARTLVAWMQAVPNGVLFDWPWLALSLAAMHLAAGSPEAASAVLVDLERLRDVTVEEQLMTDMLHGLIVLTRSPSALSVGRAEAALAAVDHADESQLPDLFGASTLADVRSIVGWTTAQAELLRGDGKAVASARSAVEGPASTPVALQVHRHATAALVEALLHNATSASSHAQRAFELAGRHLSESHPSTPMAYLARIIVARSQNDLDRAVEHVDAALELALRWDRSPLAALILAERALISVAGGEPAGAMSWLRRLERLPSTDRSALVDSRARAAELRAQVALGDPAAGWKVIDRDPDAVGWDLAFAGIVAALEHDDLRLAVKYLEAWPSAAEPFGTIERDIATALISYRQGDTIVARSLLVEVLRHTAREGTVRVYLEGGSVCLELLEALARADPPSAHLDGVLRVCRRAPHLAAAR
jgi:LuxR family transcriptional regulator, maltose regulon positive regulatory protein